MRYGLSFLIGMDSSCSRSHRKDAAEPLVAQPKPSPEERRDVDREERMAEERVSDPHVGCDGSAQVASPQHGPEDRGARDEVDDETRKLEYPEPEDDARRVAELSGRFQRRGQRPLSSATRRASSS